MNARNVSPEEKSMVLQSGAIDFSNWRSKFRYDDFGRSSERKKFLLNRIAVMGGILIMCNNRIVRWGYSFYVQMLLEERIATREVFL